MRTELDNREQAGPRWSIALETRVEWLRSRLWFIPGLFVLMALALSLLLPALDRAIASTQAAFLSLILFSGGPDSARLVLSTIAATMLTFTGLVFSVTMLVLQQASSQLSPRVMRTFLRDRFNQLVLGLFVATFLYALLVLREIRSTLDSGSFVPGLSVTAAYLLLLVSVGAFVFYLHHMAQVIRPASVLRRVGDETRSAIDELYPEDNADEPDGSAPGLPDRQPDAVAVHDGPPGVITSVEDERLLGIAREDDLTVELLHMMGGFVPSGAPVLRIWQHGEDPPAEDLDTAELAGAVHTGRDRTMAQDAAFGFRQIVDIAVKALSPGINDPTTAIQALDELHDLLRRLATRRIASPMRLDEDGNIRLRLPRPGWPDYLSLALDEIRQYGSGSIQIVRRLRHLLLDLESMVPPERQPAVTEQIALLERAIEAQWDDSADLRSARRPSASGQGPVSRPGEAVEREAFSTD